MVTRLCIGTCAILAALAEQSCDDSSCHGSVSTTALDSGMVMLQKSAEKERLDMERLPSQKLPTLSEDDSAKGSLHNTKEFSEALQAKATTNFISLGSKTVETENGSMLTTEVHSIDSSFEPSWFFQRWYNGWRHWWRGFWKSLPSFWILLPLFLLFLAIMVVCILAMRAQKDPHEEYREERYHEERPPQQYHEERSQKQYAYGSTPIQHKSLRYGASYEDQYRIPPSGREPHTMPVVWGDSLQRMDRPLHAGEVRPIQSTRGAQPLMHSQHNMTWQPDVRSGLLPLPAVRSMSADRWPIAPASMRSLSADSIYVPSSRTMPLQPSLPSVGLPQHSLPSLQHSLPLGRALVPGARPPQTFALQGPPVQMPSARFPTHLGSSGLLMPGIQSPSSMRAPASLPMSSMRPPSSLPMHSPTQGLIFAGGAGSRVVPPSSSFVPPASFQRSPVSLGRGGSSARYGSPPPGSYLHAQRNL